MKAYSIGREGACDIVLQDNTDVISRRHAVLTVSPSGKMTITDNSLNGTYVNGIKITSNIPVPVSRKDIVSFAHVTQLDWNRVPKSTSWIKYSIIGVVALLFIVCGIVGYSYFSHKGGSQPKSPTETAVPDSTKAKESTKKTDTTSTQKSKKVVQQPKKSVPHPKSEKPKSGEKDKQENKDQQEKDKNKNKDTDKAKDKSENRTIG